MTSNEQILTDLLEYMRMRDYRHVTEYESAHLITLMNECAASCESILDQLLVQTAREEE